MSNFDEEAYKESQLLASDSIINYRTVASLNADNAITKKYDDYIDGPTKRAVRASHMVGFWFGVSQFV